jgi:hypothetical protein
MAGRQFLRVSVRLLWSGWSRYYLAWKWRPGIVTNWCAVYFFAILSMQVFRKPAGYCRFRLFLWLLFNVWSRRLKDEWLAHYLLHSMIVFKLIFATTFWVLHSCQQVYPRLDPWVCRVRSHADPLHVIELLLEVSWDGSFLLQLWIESLPEKFLIALVSACFKMENNIWILRT